MSRPAKTLKRVLRGRSDANIAFADLCGMLRRLGFTERVEGSHHVFSREGVTGLLVLQPNGGKAKAYQVRQVRTKLTAHGLTSVPDADGENGRPA